MACGDRYRDLVVTATGLNLTNPYDDVGTFGDYEEWQDLAERLARFAQDAADQLGEVEGAATGGSFPLWNGTVDLKNRMVDKLDDLPDFFTGNVASSIADAQSAIFDALCVMELSADGVSHYGSTPLIVPGAPPPRDNDGLLTGATSALGWIVGAAAVGLGVVIIARGRK